MEYLEGKDLGRYVREGKRFSITEAIDYLSQAIDAISRAHAAGVIHRDVKPSNLFLTTRPDGSCTIYEYDADARPWIRNVRLPSKGGHIQVRRPRLLGAKSGRQWPAR